MSWLDGDDDLEDDFEDYDESAIRTRPNPKANRPRTKRRPAHEDAEIGRVLGVDRGRYSVLLDEDSPTERTITAAYLALLTATLSRLRLSRNEIPRGTSSADEAVIDTNTTGACLPWNLSTVPTSTSGSPAASSLRRSVTTCAL